jgi:hypothetical protein
VEQHCSEQQIPSPQQPLYTWRWPVRPKHVVSKKKNDKWAVTQAAHKQHKAKCKVRSVQCNAKLQYDITENWVWVLRSRNVTLSAQCYNEFDLWFGFRNKLICKAKLWLYIKCVNLILRVDTSLYWQKNKQVCISIRIKNLLRVQETCSYVPSICHEVFQSGHGLSLNVNKIKHFNFILPPKNTYQSSLIGSFRQNDYAIITLTQFWYANFS